VFPPSAPPLERVEPPIQLGRERLPLRSRIATTSFAARSTTGWTSDMYRLFARAVGCGQDVGLPRHERRSTVPFSFNFF